VSQPNPLVKLAATFQTSDRMTLSASQASQSQALEDTMYTEKNFRTKKALKEAVEAYNRDNAPGGNLLAPAVRYYQPGPFGGNEPLNGTFCCEGPHYPEPHRWYATCTASNGVIVKVK
jgi:hypothetical protein